MKNLENDTTQQKPGSRPEHKTDLKWISGSCAQHVSICPSGTVAVYSKRFQRPDAFTGSPDRGKRRGTLVVHWSVLDASAANLAGNTQPGCAQSR
jgi:hypothetical protein